MTIKDNLALFWGKLRVLQRGIWAPVLCYHSINNVHNSECDPLSLDLFEGHLLHLKSNYDVISVDELVHGLYGGGKLPDRPVAITFDDGYVDNCTNAFPLLLKHQLPATIYLVTNFISGEVQLINDRGWGAMTWEQARTMYSSGLISFAAHTRRHPTLSRIGNDQAFEEIDGSQNDIAKWLGIQAKTFAYPNGQGADISRRSVEIVREKEFLAAFSTFWSTRHLPQSRWLMPRVMISGSDTVTVLEGKLKGNYDYLFYWHKVRALSACLLNSNCVWR